MGHAGVAARIAGPSAMRGKGMQEQDAFTQTLLLDNPHVQVALMLATVFILVACILRVLAVAIPPQPWTLDESFNCCTPPAAPNPPTLDSWLTWLEGSIRAISLKGSRRVKLRQLASGTREIWCAPCAHLTAASDFPP